MNSYVFVTGTGRHEISENVNRCALLNVNRRILKNFFLRGDFAPKPPFLGCFDGSLLSALQAYRSGVTFFDLAISVHLIRGRANDVPIPNRLFVRVIVSAVEAPKVTHISQSES